MMSKRSDEKINTLVQLVLLYADDLWLIAEDEAGLQILLDKLDSSCKRWGMKINCSKTQIVHFRPVIS